jgi:hypothetical protein
MENLKGATAKNAGNSEIDFKNLVTCVFGCHVYFYNRNSTYSLATLQQDC